MLGVMLAATLCGWAIQDRTVTLQHSNSRGVMPLWARGTGKCYPKQLSSPASCGLSNRGERGRARANLEKLQGGRGQGVGRSTRTQQPACLPACAASSLIGFSEGGRRILQSPPSRAVKIELFLQILDETDTNFPRQQTTAQSLR